MHQFLRISLLAGLSFMALCTFTGCESFRTDFSYEREEPEEQFTQVSLGETIEITVPKGNDPRFHWVVQPQYYWHLNEREDDGDNWIYEFEAVHPGRDNLVIVYEPVKSSGSYYLRSLKSITVGFLIQREALDSKTTKKSIEKKSHSPHRSR